MARLLEDVRTSREQNTSELQEEVKRDHELRRQREITRLAAQMKGLPPPGTDIRMLERVNNTSIKRLRNSLKRATINLHATETRTDHPTVATAPVTEKKKETVLATENVPRVHQTRHATSETRFRGSLKDKREGFFETLADLLLDRSVDQLTPHLAGPTTAWDNKVIDESHPRWQYGQDHLRKHQKPGK
jgi:hypothetical protein